MKFVTDVFIKVVAQLLQFCEFFDNAFYFNNVIVLLFGLIYANKFPFTGLFEFASAIIWTMLK